MRTTGFLAVSGFVLLCNAPAMAGWEVGVIAPPPNPDYMTSFTRPPCEFTDTCIKYFPLKPGQMPPADVYTYWNPFDETLYQANRANPDARKIVWFHLVLDSNYGLIGRPIPKIGTDFGSEVTLLGATYLPWDGMKTEIFVSWLIRPQPRSETVQLAGMFIPFDKIVQMDIATSCVPEAGTWAMLIAGFGLVGGTLRRRRAQPA